LAVFILLPSGLGSIQKVNQIPIAIWHFPRWKALKRSWSWDFRVLPELTPSLTAMDFSLLYLVTVVFLPMLFIPCISVTFHWFYALFLVLLDAFFIHCRILNHCHLGISTLLPKKVTF
jgi:hypothetical protein